MPVSRLAGAAFGWSRAGGRRSGAGGAGARAGAGERRWLDDDGAEIEGLAGDEGEAAPGEWPGLEHDQEGAWLGAMLEAEAAVGAAGGRHAVDADAEAAVATIGGEDD